MGDKINDVGTNIAEKAAMIWNVLTCCGVLSSRMNMAW